ncbi:MAG: exonuclease domain-containing protein [Candidatus Andersenbacteria bacterium]|nr:exonuclease domain-containing protein [Candidatus Andersenbacteria bacterium]
MTSETNTPEKFVVFDTEFTTWEGAHARNWSGPNEYREIVQIAAAKVDGQTLEISDTFVRFVKPVKNPILSEYFINLTGIPQTQVDAEGITYEQALQEFKQWAEDLPNYCYGTDNLVMAENCELIGITFPFLQTQFHDVRKVFQNQGIPAEKYMSSTIVEAFGAKPTRRGHDALNDVKTIIDGLKLLRKKTS